tara:strand:- start:15419 stop:16207 length:789 start_codon:yes stop_codon:yes gene_type:complete
MDSQMNNTDLYCGACCINLLHDDDIVSCECCTCDRVPNEIMFEREIIKKKIEMDFQNQTKCIQPKDKMDTMIDYSGYSKKVALMKMFDAALGEGWSIPTAEGWVPPTKPAPTADPKLINKITGFDKRTHSLTCDNCGEEEYAESIGVWNDEGYLTGALCGACEEKEDEDDEWAACYGAKTLKTREYIMAGGGAHWWNYIAEFDENERQVAVYIENKDGRHQQFRQLLAYRNNEDGVEQLRLVPMSWEPDCDKNEGWVSYVNE